MALTDDEFYENQKSYLSSDEDSDYDDYSFPHRPGAGGDYL